MQMDLDAFADRLQHYRKNQGWSQSDLAREVWGEITLKTGRKAAKNRDRISTYEMGKSWPDPQNLAAIAKALGVTAEELAPNITASTVARQNPALSITQIEGHDDMVLVQVNRQVSEETALEIMRILRQDSRNQDSRNKAKMETPVIGVLNPAI
jgi:transcriptional regulator with XRE-family HTH domain